MLYDKDIEAYYCVLNEKKKKIGLMCCVFREVEDYWNMYLNK